MKMNTQQKVDEVMDSLDGIQPAAPAPFFYTRVIGRLQREENGTWEKIATFLSKPAVAVAGLFVIILFNGFLVLKQQVGSKGLKAPVAGNNEIVTDNEYVLATNTSFEYENIDQQ